MAHICTAKLNDHQTSLTEVGGARSLKKNLERYITISSDNPLSLYYFKSSVDIKKEQKRQLGKKYLVIHPFSKFRKWYDIYLIFLYASVLITKPLDHGFTRRANYANFAFYGLYTLLTDLLCVVDIVLQFFTGYVENMKTIELGRKAIARKYVYGPNFVCDVISTIPKSVCYYLLPRGYTFKIILGILNIFYLFKIVRLASLLIQIEKISHYFSKRSRNIFLLNTLIILIILVHWLTCLQYGFPRMIRFYFTFTRRSDTWFMRYNLGELPLHIQYVHSFFKSSAYILGVRLTRIYREVLSEEFIMGVLTYFFGKIMMVLVWIVFAVAILNSRCMDTKFMAIINQLDEYMKRKQLPLNLREKIAQCYHFRYRKGFINEDLITGYFSNDIIKDIKIHTCRSLIQMVSLFSTLTTAEVSKVIQYLQPEIFMPNDIIIRSGDLGNSMYFLFSGTVAVYTASGKEICHLQEGAYFGEISLLLKGQSRTATIVAIEMTHVYKMIRKDFDRYLMTNKSVRTKLVQDAKKRLQETTKIEERYKKTVFEQTFQKQSLDEAPK
ncbi:hypothetical protein NQ318_016955 [Aromia moschata]|uniref:Cyclic nucleotide-binding domain-containing protein n=1 Tax=Aromia moschata TaxID=1265417 RepID=A0AAV8YDG6_9CUCU|nr:hypothetical protein NQ318_016955 [Aromia moschata]